MELSIRLNKGRRLSSEEILWKNRNRKTAPSKLAIMGRYVLTPEIFKFLEKQEAGAGGEIQLTDAIQKLNETEVYAYDFEGNGMMLGRNWVL